MKKLLTIICALCLVMAFSMPAGAVDDIDPNVGVAVDSPNTTQTGVSDKSQIVTDNSMDDRDDNSNWQQDNSDNSMDDRDDNSNWQQDNSDNSANDASDNSTNLCESQNDNSDNSDNSDHSNWQQDNSDNSDNSDNRTATANDSFNDDHSDDDGTDVDVTTGDLLSGNDDHSDDDVVDNKNGAMDNDLVDQDGDQDINDQKYGDNDLVDQDNTDNDLVDQDGDQDINDQKYGDNDLADNDMNGNMAAAAMGGFAIGVSIEDIELNLASTTSNVAFTQTSNFNNSPSATNDGKKDGDSKAEGFFSECHSVDASVYSNTGITGANFTAGNFNNSANLNNVTMTVQY